MVDNETYSCRTTHPFWGFAHNGREQPTPGDGFIQCVAQRAVRVRAAAGICKSVIVVMFVMRCSRAAALAAPSPLADKNLWGGGGSWPAGARRVKGARGGNPKMDEGAVDHGPAAVAAGAVSQTLFAVVAARVQLGSARFLFRCLLLSVLSTLLRERPDESPPCTGLPPLESTP